MPRRKQFGRRLLAQGLVPDTYKRLWQGLRGLYVINAGTGTVLHNFAPFARGTADRMALTRTTGGDWAASLGGFAVETIGTDFRYESNSIADWAQLPWPISILWVGSIVATPGTNSGIAGIVRGTGNPKFNFALGFGSSDPIRLYYGGASSIRGVDLDGITTVGTDHRIVATRGTADAGSYYYRGRKLGDLSFGSGALTYHATQSRWQLGNGNTAVTGNSQARHELFAIWDRRLSDGEGRLLTADPYSWLTPRRQMTAAVGGSPQSAALGVISVGALPGADLASAAGLGEITTTVTPQTLGTELGSAIEEDLEPIVSVGASVQALTASTAAVPGTGTTSFGRATRRRGRR